MQTIIAEIVNMPTEFTTRKDISIYTLLKNTGYFEHFEEIHEENILRYLVQHPESVQQWLNYSEDKRTDSGWAFYQDEPGKYIVEYYPQKGSFIQNEFSTAEEACASFIILEIKDIRKY